MPCEQAEVADLNFVGNIKEFIDSNCIDEVRAVNFCYAATALFTNVTSKELPWGALAGACVEG